MPLKNGRLTYKEQQFAARQARLEDPTRAAELAGYGSPAARASELMQRPAVQAEIAKRQQEILFGEILPLAIDVHKRILADERAPAGARVQAVKLAYDRTLGLDGAGHTKEPHEMTAEEIAQAIGRLEQVAAARAKPVEPSTIVDLEPEKPDLFA